MRIPFRIMALIKLELKNALGKKGLACINDVLSIILQLFFSNVDQEQVVKNVKINRSIFILNRFMLLVIFLCKAIYYQTNY